MERQSLIDEKQKITLADEKSGSAITSRTVRTFLPSARFQLELETRRK